MAMAQCSASVSSKLNVVLCGADATLKYFVSELLRGKLKKPLTHRVSSTSVCVKKEEKVRGRLINVVELPALTGLSHEEMMCESFTAVSLCGPGVHVFLIILPVGPLTDVEKEEIEKIQKIFNSTDHFMMAFMSDVTVETYVRNSVESYSESQRLSHLCEGRYTVIGLKEHKRYKPASIELLEYIENMKTEPYSLHMYARAQDMRGRQETEEKYNEKLSEVTSKIKDLQLKISSYGVKDDQEDLRHLRIVLIGRTGHGKSATGNTILGRNEFESLASTGSVTSVCEKRVGEVDGVSVSVVDTPGLFDTTLTNEQVMDELVKCVSLSSPGPHAFIIVLSVGRFIREESDTIDLIRMFFGPEVVKFSIVLFTRGDDLKGESIEDYVKRSKNRDLIKLLRDCGDRFLMFNNNETQDRSQVTRLMNMIEEMKTTNHCRYFNNSMFEEAEMSIKKRMEEILKEKEREIQIQREELTVKHEIEKENTMKRLEEEKRKSDEERMKMISKFNKQEETLRKEFEENEKTDRLEREKEKKKQIEEEKRERAEYHMNIEEMKREIENQRSLHERNQRGEKDVKREEKYRQDQEEIKAKENIIIQLYMRQEEEIRKRKSKEDQKRQEEEERERQEWRRRIREAENDRKETQEETKRQQIEWEEDKKQQTREREKDERKRRENHDEQLKEKQEELEKMRKTFEKKTEEERRQRDEESEKQRREREKRVREHQEKKNYIMKHYEQLERERKETWARRKQEVDEGREEERKKWEKRIDDIKREQEEEIKRRETQERNRKEREEEEQEKRKEEHERRIKEMKKKHEDEARKQAEELNEFSEEKEQHVEEKLNQHLKQQDCEETEEQQTEVEYKKTCVIL